MTVDSSFVFLQKIVRTNRRARSIGISLLAFLSIATGLGQAANAAQPMVIRNVTVVDIANNRLLANRNVSIESGKITAVSPTSEVRSPSGAAVIEGGELYLIPGLWDSHVHLANREQPLLTPTQAAALYLKSGVVGVRDMGSDLERLRTLEQAIDSGRSPGPIIVKSGPFLDSAPTPYPAMRAVGPDDDIEALVDELAASGVDFLKIQAKLSAETFTKIATAANRRGIQFAGHVPDAVTVADVVAAGQRSIEHLSPALPSDGAVLFSCSSREDELRAELAAMAGLERSEYRPRRDALQLALIESYDADKAAKLFAELAANNTFVVPTLIWSSTMAPFRPEIAEDTPLEWLPRESVERWLAGRKAYFEDPQGANAARIALNKKMDEFVIEVVGDMFRAGVDLVAGSDSTDGIVLPGFSLHQELEFFVHAGMSPAAALQSATATAAALVGRSSTHGTIEVGKSADLVLLSANPLTDIRNSRKVAGVVAAGRYYDRAALDSLAPNSSAKTEEDDAASSSPDQPTSGG